MLGTIKMVVSMTSKVSILTELTFYPINGRQRIHKSENKKK